MRLVNRSGYDTADLKAFMTKAFKAYRVDPRGIEVIVVSAPKRSRGCASVGATTCSGGRCRTSQGRRIVLATAPPSYNPTYASWLRRFSQLVRHECAHLRGLEHEDMAHDLLYSLGPTPPWARDAKIRYRGRAPNQMKGLG